MPDFSCFFLFTGAWEVEDTRLSSVCDALQRPSATFMRSRVFGVVSKLAVTIELSMSLIFPRWNVSSLSLQFNRRSIESLCAWKACITEFSDINIVYCLHNSLSSI